MQLGLLPAFLWSQQRLPQNLGRSFKLSTLLTALRSYAAATSALNVTALSKTIGGLTAKLLYRLFACARACDAHWGEKLNSCTRLRKSVEVDGHEVRTAWLSKNTTKYVPEKDELFRRHPAPRLEFHAQVSVSQVKPRKAKHLLLHFAWVGAFERQSEKCILEPCRPRVMLPSSRPPQESAEDVREAQTFVPSVWRGYDL